MIGALLVVAAVVLAVLVGFGVTLLGDLSLVESLAFAVILGFVGVLVGVAVPWRRP